MEGIFFGKTSTSILYSYKGKHIAELILQNRTKTNRKATILPLNQAMENVIKKHAIEHTSPTHKAHSREEKPQSQLSFVHAPMRKLDLV